MRMSQLFGKTLRDNPSEADTTSHRLLIRAGMISQVAAGIYSYLPLALRAMRKIETIIREEVNAAGGQEILMPVLQPAELWARSGRDEAFGETLFHLKDRRERPMVLAPTHEEVVTDLARRHVRSYRDLPLNLYQIQTKLRDEARPRAGLVRVREFAMKDAYTFDADEAGLDRAYQRMAQAYWNIFTRCGVDVIAVEADSGAIGGKDSQEFMLVAESGEDELVHCRSCGYAANVEKAGSRYPPSQSDAAPLPMEAVDTPGMATIADVGAFLNVDENRTLKSVMYACHGDVILAVIRGDLEINEVKLANALGCPDVRLATDDELRNAGLTAGYASAVGLADIKSIGDRSATEGVNFVAGANEPGRHLINVNYGRDFQLDQVLDLVKAQPGHACSRCGHELSLSRGIEVGHVFKLGTTFSEAFDAQFVDQDGVEKVLWMGCYGIGVGRLLGAAIESNNDDRGIIFPPAIAPFDVHLVALNPERAEIREAADELYEALRSAGLEVLYDDREESAGIKFSDADLLGMPLRATVSARSLREGRNTELKLRPGAPDTATVVAIDDAVNAIRTLLQQAAEAERAAPSTG